MFAGYIEFADDELRMITHKGTRIELTSSSICRINSCRYEDPAQDEEFFILCMREQFCLIGPFVKNSGATVSALRNKHPEIPFREIIVQALPWRLREPGYFGLRIFPIAGLGVFSKKYFPKYSCTGDKYE